MDTIERLKDIFGSFFEQNFESFGEAIVKKLVAEIADLSPETPRG